MTVSRLWVSVIIIAGLTACGDKADRDKPFTPDPPKAAPLPAAFNGTEVEVKVGALAGTYIQAEGDNRPTVIIVPGSGPTDRNGNGPDNMGLHSDSYKYLAQGLYAQGISSVRVDKAGMFGSVEAEVGRPSFFAGYAQDYRNWAAEFAPQSKENCVYLLGHSEGALMVSLAAKGQDNICGLVLVSGAGRKFGDIMRAQFRDNPMNAPLLIQAEAALDAIEQGGPVDTSDMHPAVAAIFSTDNQPYLLEALSANPAVIAGDADMPTLIVQGDRDIQITVEDAKLLHEATNGELVILEGVNHILKFAPEDFFGNAATYTQVELPIAPEAITAIANFINRP